jgi:hypothetical protein
MSARPSQDLNLELSAQIVKPLVVAFDCAENAPPSTMIKCRHCGAPRETVRDVRKLSISQRQTLFDI